MSFQLNLVKRYRYQQVEGQVHSVQATGHDLTLNKEREEVIDFPYHHQRQKNSVGKKPAETQREKTTELTPATLTYKQIHKGIW